MSTPRTAEETRVQGPRAKAGPGLALQLLACRVHFLAGIVVAPFLVVLSLTGLIYAFSPQIHDNLYHSHLHVNEIRGTPKPVSDQVRAALAAHPEGSLREVIPQPQPDRTTQVVLSVPGLKGTGDAAEGRTVFVDPYTNYINGELTTVGNRLPANVWLRQLHSNLRLGEPGRLYAELAASWLPVIILGGLVLWFVQPRRRKRVTWRELLGAKDPPGRLRVLHGPLGLCLAVGLLILSITGLTMSKYAGGRTDQAINPAHLRAPAVASAPLQVKPAPMPGNPMPTPENPTPAPETPPPIAAPLPPAPETWAKPKTPTPANPPAAPGTPPTTLKMPPPAPEVPPTGPPTTPPPTTPPPTTGPPTTGPPPEPAPLLTLPLLPIALPGIPGLPGIPLAASTVPASATVTQIGIDQALAVARAEGLSGEVIVTPPHGDSGVFTVVENSVGLPILRDSIAIDSYSGRVTQRIGWRDYSLAAKLSTLGAEFHTGTLFGLANQIVLAALAIGLLVLIALVYRMWWVHNPYRGSWTSLPPLVSRQLSRPALGLILLAAAALSWVLPVFGVSLVGFVIVDGAIITIRRRRQHVASGRRHAAPGS